MSPRTPSARPRHQIALHFLRGVALASLAATTLLPAPASAQNAAPPAAPVPPNYLGALSAELEPSAQIVYQGAGQKALQLHVFNPGGWTRTDRRPAFVLFHGGGWTRGEPRSMYSFGKWAAEHGVVAFSAQYRLHQPEAGVTVFDSVADARAAVRYIRAHAAELGVDPTRIVVGGASAGGHLAVATVMFDELDPASDSAISCRADALVLFSPVIDTSPEGYGQAKLGLRWRDLSPVHHVTRGLPPTITFHGTADAVTPFAGAQAFHTAMLASGNPSELVVAPGAPHTYMFKDARLYAETMARVQAFLGARGLIQSGGSQKVPPAGTAPGTK
jgi:acetyl esterase